MLVVFPAPPQPHVVMISIDGLVPDYYVTPDRLGLQIPNLRKLRRAGASADGVIGVYPSVTYPSHTTMVTGAKPADHGVIANRVFDEPTKPRTERWYWEVSYLKTETIWAAAHRAGLSVAALSWPVTVGAKEIDYHVPEYWDPRAGQASLEFLRTHATPGLIDDVLKGAGKTDRDYPRKNDDFITEAAVQIISRHKPNLTLIHLIELDTAQHDHGPFSRQAFEMIERQDKHLGRILQAIRDAGVEEMTTVAIVSDHGFMRVDRQFHPGVLLVEAGLIQLDKDGRVINWEAMSHPHGGSASIYLREPGHEQVLAQVRQLFAQHVGEQKPLRQILERKQLDELRADPGAALFLEAATHVGIGDKLRGPLIEPASEGTRGKHGYLPERPEMFASLIMAGRGIKAGARKETVRMTDIAPTLAKRLNISLESKPYSRPLLDWLVISH
jgi:predicted AlkP superfamily phosphohydrolase/phosphomutase